MEQYYAAIIMFLATLMTTTLFFLPITRLSPKSKMLRFYWNGVWGFLVMIAAFAGAGNTLMLLGFDSMISANVFLTGLIAAFVVFVVFAWFRLCGAALWAGIKRLRGSSSASATGPVQL